MRFIKNLFVSDSIEDINTVLYSLKRDIAAINIYVVCADEESGLCEIVSSVEYLSRLFDSTNKRVCGVASGKYEAYRLFCQMLQYGEDCGWQANDFGKNILEE